MSKKPKEDPVFAAELPYIEDNQIRFDVSKFLENATESIQTEHIKSERGKAIIDKLVLLALPSPSQHNH